MVKKVMLPLCGSTSGGRPVAPCSALCHRGNPPVVQPLEKAEHFLFLDGFSLDGSARRTLLHRLPGESDPRSISCIDAGREGIASVLVFLYGGSVEA